MALSLSIVYNNETISPHNLCITSFSPYCNYWDIMMATIKIKSIFESLAKLFHDIAALAFTLCV